MSTEAVGNVVWSGLANDLPGILVFLLWLLLPPLYTVVLGRRYAARCEDSAQQAVWANEELRKALEDLDELRQFYVPPEDVHMAEPLAVPSAREYRQDDTDEIATVRKTPTTGRHRLRADRSPLLARLSA
jgi:hypothetical protein